MSRNINRERAKCFYYQVLIAMLMCESIKPIELWVTLVNTNLHIFPHLWPAVGEKSTLIAILVATIQDLQGCRCKRNRNSCYNLYSRVSVWPAKVTQCTQTPVAFSCGGRRFIACVCLCYRRRGVYGYMRRSMSVWLCSIYWAVDRWPCFRATGFLLQYRVLGGTESSQIFNLLN